MHTQLRYKITFNYQSTYQIICVRIKPSATAYYTAEFECAGRAGM